MKQTRPPIIAVVGHIDHGKSKLQHALRSMDIQKEETGDITQHIGAYELHAEYEGNERRATIIDTPGHEAFSHIREHGLELADIALLVVSSEEGWKEQTSEAYNQIVKKNLPFIIIFTKIDLEQSNIEKTKQTLMQQGILLEGFGGSVPWIGVSSITKEGIDDLIELIFLTVDVYEIVEERKDGSIGVLVEADIDPKIGIAGTIIVLQGTLEISKHVRVGESTAPLRIMQDDRGRNVKEVVPSTPIRVFGFNTIPPIGAPVFLYATKKEALESAKKESQEKEKELPSADEGRDIPLVLRSDTASGLISVENAINAVSAEGVKFIVVKKGVGEITEEDVRLVQMRVDGHVIGFHTTANQQARFLSERTNNPIHLFPTIYEIIEWAKKISKQKKEVYELDNKTGSATVIRIFEEKPTQGSYIIGGQVINGSFSVQQEIVIQRNNVQMGRFTIESIEQRNKEQTDISGVKNQFAMRLSGSGEIALQDTVIALPIIQKK